MSCLHSQAIKKKDFADSVGANVDDCELEQTSEVEMECPSDKSESEVSEHRRPRHATPRHATPRHATPRRAALAQP